MLTPCATRRCGAARDPQAADAVEQLLGELFALVAGAGALALHRGAFAQMCLHRLASALRALRAAAPPLRAGAPNAHVVPSPAASVTARPLWRRQRAYVPCNWIHPTGPIFYAVVDAEFI